MAQLQEQEAQKGQEAGNKAPAGADQSKPGGEQLSYENTPPPENTQRKSTVRFVLLALLVVALIAAIPIYSYYAARESTDDAQVEGHLIPISPRINGTILEVLVKDNEQVKAGQPLVKLDPADYEVAVAQAEAQLASAQANTAESGVSVPITDINTLSQVGTSKSQTEESQAAVTSAQQSVDEARARIASANATLVGKQADLVKAQKDLERFKDLVAKDEVSKQDYDAATASADARAADVDSAKANVTAAQRTYDKAVADLSQARSRVTTALVLERQSAAIRPRQQQMSEARYRQAQAQVQQAEANLRQAKLNVGYTIIKSPMDGVVSRKSAEPGMQVAQGQQIMAIVPLDDVWVVANFKETQLRKLRVGQKVRIEVDTYGGSGKYWGHIESVAAASGGKFSLLPPENATGNYVKVVQRVPVKILLEPGENGDHRLLPGMSVTPTVMLGSGN